MAKDFKNKPKSSLTDALFFKDKYYSTLVEIVQELGINTTQNPRQLNLANKITNFVESKCPGNCLFEMPQTYQQEKVHESKKPDNIEIKRPFTVSHKGNLKSHIEKVARSKPEKAL